MLSLIQPAFAAEEVIPVDPAAFDGGFMGLMPIILITIIIYFLLLRPAIKKQKEHEKLLDELTRGERVIFAGGIIGTITKIDDSEGIVQIELTQNVKIEALKASITDRLGKKKKDPELDKNEKKKLKTTKASA